MDKNSLHFKGTYRNIYEVNKAYPNGGVKGDYVEINGWQHWWDADRGTWCVNENRDTYWDEILSTIQNIVYSKGCNSESDFPANPTYEEQRVAYFYNGELYLYTGTNGTIRNGQYRSFGVVQGQRGVGVSSFAQTETSNVDGGKNTVTVTLTNGEQYRFYTYNGTGRNKGYYYKSLEELQSSVPDPSLTDWAVVDGNIFVCEEKGTWKDTGYSWKPIKLNPLLELLNATDKPLSASYLHWNGGNFEWKNPTVSSGGSSSGGGGVSQSELQAAIKTALKNYKWWGRSFGDSTSIEGNMLEVGSIQLCNTTDGVTKTKLLYLDKNGDLCFDGNFYATGGITALGQSSISGGGTSGGSALEIVRTVDETATTLTTAAKKLNFIYPSSWGNIIQKANDDGSEINIRLELLPSGSGSSSGPLANGFFVKCDGETIGTGFNGNSGMAIDLRAGSGISLSASEDTYYNKKITISATGGGSGSIQVATLPEYSSGSENWISGSKFRFYQQGSKLTISENTTRGTVDIVIPESSSGSSVSGNVQLNNMLYFYGSETAGGTPTNKGGYDNSYPTYVKFQGSGVTVTTGKTRQDDDTTIVTISGGSGGSSSVSWSDITSKPSTFAPSSHTHSTSDITNFTSAVQAIKVTSALAADKLANARTIWGQSFNGTANVTGSLSSVTDVNLTGSIKYTSGTAYSNGSMELYHSTPFIDFHYNKSAADYTARLIADGENLLSFLTNSGTGIFDLQNNKLKIGNGYLVWDDTNKSFRMMSSNGGNCNFYCDGGITALGVQSTSTSNSDFTFKNVTADCFKVIKTDNSNIFHLENTKGDNPIVKCYFDGDELVIYNNTDYIAINEVEIDNDGYLYAAQLCCDENGVFRADGSYLRLGDSENNVFVVFWHDSKGYRLDMSKAISLGIFTQLSTQELSTLEAKVKKKVSA